jgi:hypothetical protein
MDSNQDDSMEDGIQRKSQEVAKDAEQRMAVPIAAFHPMLGQLTVNMDVLVERQEKLSST